MLYLAAGQILLAAHRVYRRRRVSMLAVTMNGDINDKTTDISYLRKTSVGPNVSNSQIISSDMRGQVVHSVLGLAVSSCYGSV